MIIWLFSTIYFGFLLIGGFKLCLKPVALTVNKFAVSSHTTKGLDRKKSLAVAIPTKLNHD